MRVLRTRTWMTYAICGVIVVAFIPWSDANSGQPSGLGGFVDGGVAAARSFACGLYRNYDRFFGNGLPQTPISLPIRDMWENLCPPPAIPPTPVEPPIGEGPCACNFYICRLRRTIPDVGTSTIQPTPLLGPIYGLVETISQDGTAVSHSIRHGRCVDGALVGDQLTNISSAGLGTTVVFISIVPVDDAAPCNAQNPPTPIVPPPADDQIRYVPIPSPRGPVVVPVILVKPTFAPQFDIDVQVKVGPINITFQIDGINIDFSPDPDYPVLPPATPLPPLPPATPRPNPFPRPSPLPDRWDEVIDLLEDIKECSCEPAGSIQSQILSSGNGATVAIPSNARFIRVELTQIPDNAKVEFGNNNSPNVYYAGWYAFGFAGSDGGDRNPIHYQQQGFPVPKDAARFTYTVRVGFSATITAFVFIPAPS